MAGGGSAAAASSTGAGGAGAGRRPQRAHPSGRQGLGRHARQQPRWGAVQPFMLCGPARISRHCAVACHSAGARM